jgi:hypothetical protein
MKWIWMKCVRTLKNIFFSFDFSMSKKYFWISKKIKPPKKLYLYLICLIQKILYLSSKKYFFHSSRLQCAHSRLPLLVGVQPRPEVPTARPPLGEPSRGKASRENHLARA